MLGYIYKISFINSSKSYIGQTIKNPHKRLKIHIQTADRGSGCALHKAIIKYGTGNILFDIIEECPLYCNIHDKQFTLDEKEKYYIKLYDTFGKNGYNLTKGGEGSIGREISDETRKRLSSRATGRKLSDETKALISKSSKNKIFTQDTRDKLSKANKGKITVKDEYGHVFTTYADDENYINGAYVAASKGTKRTQEQLEKMSKVHKNKVMVEIDGSLVKINRDDIRIINGELSITSNVKGLSIHSTEEKLKRSVKMMENNPNAIIVDIFDNDGLHKFVSTGNFINFLKENGLPHSLAASYRNNGTTIGRTPQTKAKLINNGYEKYVGWKAIKRD